MNKREEKIKELKNNIKEAEELQEEIMTHYIMLEVLIESLKKQLREVEKKDDSKERKAY